jgi:GntR family transcriptional repressor for pyruvate dehydrogenase complex
MSDLTHAADELARGSAVDRLVERVRELVAARGLRPGDAIPTERELCEAFGASRNTVREALATLRAFGLIETRPKSGATVADGYEDAARRLFSLHHGVSAEGFRDVQEFRRVLETGVGDHLMLHASAEDLDRLATINDAMVGLDGVDDRARADYAFHEGLIGLSGNRTMLVAFRTLRPTIETIMRVGKSVRTVGLDTHAAHEEIIGAVRERDRVAYAYLIGRHLRYGLRFIEGG